jgi:hypothetical protein
MNWSLACWSKLSPGFNRFLRWLADVTVKGLGGAAIFGTPFGFFSLVAKQIVS